MPEMENIPWSLTGNAKLMPERLVSTACAPGRAAPLESVTFPVMRVGSPDAPGGSCPALNDNPRNTRISTLRTRVKIKEAHEDTLIAPNENVLFNAIRKGGFYMAGSFRKVNVL